MRQLKNVMRFEFTNTAKSTVYIVTTILLAVAILVVFTYPRAAELIRGEKDPDSPSFIEGLVDSDFSDTTLLVNNGDASEASAAFFAESLDCKAEATDLDRAALEKKVLDEEVDYAIVFTDALSYTLIQSKVGLTDTLPYIVQELVLTQYRSALLTKYGVSAQEMTEFFSAAVTSETVAVDGDNTVSYIYTYILMMLLYMVILLYGQIVAQGVAAEKSSRAMELLITTTKPTSLLFGKVLGIGAAGLLQMMCWIACAILGYVLNLSYWEDNAVVGAIFGASGSLLGYTVLFFVLGYLLYSFLFGAMGSLASRLEDVNSVCMPLVLLVVIGFIACMMAMSMDMVDSTMIVALSYIPFTSPLAMFIRITMGSVASWEIAVSVVILIGSIIGSGYLAAAIYRIGVLLYGKPPKLGELFRLLRGNKKQTAAK